MKKFDIKKYLKTIIILCVILVAVVILAVLKPSETDLFKNTSPEMQKMIEQDANSTRKRVTVTYNNLLIINYASLSTSGAKVMSEKYVGFLGKVYPADKGGMKITGQMVNYTYRMLGCGENLMHGAKLTITLTTLTVLFGVLLGTILAAYRDFEDRVNVVREKMSAFEMVQKAVNSKLGKFTKSDIMELCPEIGRASVENALKKLCDDGKIEKHGGGRSIFYSPKN